MKVEIDLTVFDTEDLKSELSERGELPDEVTVEDFSDDELREALGIPEDQEDIDWNEMYNKLMSGSGEQAFEEFKQIIQDRTGRIIV